MCLINNIFLKINQMLRLLKKSRKNKQNIKNHFHTYDEMN